MLRLVPFALLLLIACTNNPVHNQPPLDSIVQDGTVVADTQQVIVDTVPPVREPQGIYSAVIPVKENNPSIEMTVAFLPDRRYRMEEKTGNKPVQKTSGTWSPSGGIIWLYNDHVVKARCQWIRDTLYYMHGDAHVTPMEKRVAATDNDVWRRKGAEGLEFFGVGTEPFWNIDIDEQRSIKFQLADWDKPKEFRPVQPFVSSDSLVYTTGNDTSHLVATVYQAFCSDGMSDFIYTQQVTVRYRGSVYQGCGILFRR